MRCSYATSNYTSGGESCSSFCLVTFPPQGCQIVSIQLHGLSDASQLPYTGVVYLRIIDGQGGMHSDFFGNL